MSLLDLRYEEKSILKYGLRVLATLPSGISIEGSTGIMNVCQESMRLLRKCYREDYEFNGMELTLAKVALNLFVRLGEENVKILNQDYDFDLTAIIGRAEPLMKKLDRI